MAARTVAVAKAAGLAVDSAVTKVARAVPVMGVKVAAMKTVVAMGRVEAVVFGEDLAVD
jgi:hypothetical protein